MAPNRAGAISACMCARRGKDSRGKFAAGHDKGRGAWRCARPLGRVRAGESRPFARIRDVQRWCSRARHGCHWLCHPRRSAQSHRIQSGLADGHRAARAGGPEPGPGAALMSGRLLPDRDVGRIPRVDLREPAPRRKAVFRYRHRTRAPGCRREASPALLVGAGPEVGRSQFGWKTNVRNSMLSRGRASAGVVGSVNEVCAIKRARPSVFVSQHLSSTASSRRISGT